MKARWNTNKCLHLGVVEEVAGFSQLTAICLVLGKKPAALARGADAELSMHDLDSLPWLGESNHRRITPSRSIQSTAASGSARPKLEGWFHA